MTRRYWPRVVPAIPAGSWAAAGNRFFKLPRPPVIPISRYTGRLSGIALNGGQAAGIVLSNGTLTVQVGPQGLGTLWYPASATISTTTGPLDTSTAQVYLGPGGVPTTLLATVYTGNGLVGAALPNMQPGDLIIVKWTGAHPGDIGALNIVGTMDALTTGAGQ